MDVVLLVNIDGHQVPMTLKQYSTLFGDGGPKVTIPKETNDDNEESEEDHENFIPQHLLNNPSMSIMKVTTPASTSTKDIKQEKQVKRTILNKKPTVKPTLDTNFDGVYGHGEPSTSTATNKPRSRSQSPKHTLAYFSQAKPTSDTLDSDKSVIASTSTENYMHVEKRENRIVFNEKWPLIYDKSIIEFTLEMKHYGVRGHSEPSTSTATNKPRLRSLSPVHVIVFSFQNRNTSNTLDPDNPVVASTSTTDTYYMRRVTLKKKRPVLKVKPTVKSTLGTGIGGFSFHSEPSTSNATNRFRSSFRNDSIQIHLLQPKDASDILDPDRLIYKPPILRIVVNENETVESSNPNFRNSILINVINNMIKKVLPQDIALLKNDIRICTTISI